MGLSKKISHTLNNIKMPARVQVNCSSDITEKIPLLSSSSVSFTKRLSIFLCSKGAPSYTTLYSLPYLSSPIVVIITGIITASFLIITIASLII